VASVYCQPADLITTGVNAIALQDVPVQDQLVACQQASELADSYIRGRYALPLSAWGADVTFRTAQIAVYLTLKSRGYNPSAGADDNVRQGYEDSIRWFEGIQRQNTHPDVTPAVAQPGDPIHDLPQVITSQQRGFQYCAGKIPSVS
jgi:phage gp36-like protein